MALACDRFEVFWGQPEGKEKKRLRLLALADVVFGSPASDAAPGNAVIVIRERDGSEVARIEDVARNADGLFDLIAADLNRLSPEDFMAEWGIAPDDTH